MQPESLLGKLIEQGNGLRDAVHIAIFPGRASCVLSPGEPVGFTNDGSLEWFGFSEKTVGIVDPFLKEDVNPGEFFWVLIYPGTTHSLRHIWTHKEFEGRSWL